MIGITAKQAECLAYLKAYTADNGGVSPTVREIMEAMSLASSAGVQRLLNGLEERGLIRRLRHRARAIEIVSPLSDFPTRLAALSDEAFGRALDIVAAEIARRAESRA